MGGTAKYMCPEHGEFVVEFSGQMPLSTAKCPATIEVDGASVTDIYEPGTVSMPFSCDEVSPLMTTQHSGAGDGQA